MTLLNLAPTTGAAPGWRRTLGAAILPGLALLAACAPMPATAPAPSSPAVAAADTAAQAPAAPVAGPAHAPARPALPKPARPAPPSSLPASTPPPVAPSAGTAAPWRIDTARSLIAVTVRRAGMLARLGHDHLVAARDISGSVALAQNRADFQFRLDRMSVDDAALRAEARLDTQPSADAIAGTRDNMLTKVLDAQRFPLVTVHVERRAGDPALQASITLHGVTRTLALPALVSQSPSMLSVSGTLRLKQSDFGLTPFAVMGGAIAVADELELRYVLVATP